jgi:hypothetical protein
MVRILMILLALLCGQAAAFASTAPVNLAPNSQWEVWSAVGYETQYNYQGTGTTAPLTASANTTGSVGRSTFTVSTTADLSVGDLVKASGSGIDACFAIGPMRIVGLVANTSITVRTYFGCVPTVNHATTLTMVGVGNQAAAGTGAGPDGWTKTTSLPIWRNENRGSYASNLPSNVGAIAVLGAKKDIAGTEYIYATYAGANLAQFAGKTVVFGIDGYQKVRGGSGTWAIYFNDSVNGVRTPCAAAPTTAGYNWLECSVTIPANTTYFYVGVALQGAADDTYYLADPVLAIGNSIGGVANYQKPRNEILIPTVHISPIGWINAAITFPSAPVASCGGFTYCFEHDFYAETGGGVAMTVQKAHGQIEGIDCGTVQTSTAAVRVMAYYDRVAAPGKSGSFLPQYVRCVKSFSYMDFPFDQTSATNDAIGTGVYVSNIASDTWSNVSEELDWFILN